MLPRQGVCTLAMKYLLPIIAIGTGFLLVLQMGMNSRLSRHLGSDATAIFIASIVTLLVSGLVLLIARPGLPGAAQIASARPVDLVAGVIGIGYLLVSIYLAPRLGIARSFALIVAGQILFSLIADHFGWFGLERRPLDVNKGLAALLLIGALYFFQRE